MKACGKSWTTIQRATILHRKSTVTKLPEFLTDYSFVLIQVEMEKKKLCRSTFWSFVIHSFNADMEVGEVQRGKQGQACVCVFPSRLQTWAEMAENWRMNFSCFALFAPFCSVLSLCVIPGDVNWHVAPPSQPSWHKLGRQLDMRGRWRHASQVKCHDFTL